MNAKDVAVQAALKTIGDLKLSSMTASNLWDFMNLQRKEENRKERKRGAIGLSCLSFALSLLSLGFWLASCQYEAALLGAFAGAIAGTATVWWATVL